MIAVTDKRRCYGCGACASRCTEASITMVEDEEGFLYPKVDVDTCTDCGLCDIACPVNGTLALTETPDVYACKNNNARVRLESTSGGCFTLMAEHALEQKGVVFGAIFDQGFQVVHGAIERKDDVWKLRGSKYSQSVIGDTFQQAETYLQAGRQVLFSGTPCQIAGLRSFLDRDYPNLLAVDLICHGVPSPKVYRQYLGLLKDRYGEEIEKVAFRDKNRGWKLFSFSIFFKQNLYSQAKFDDLFMRGFLASYFLRPACHACLFKGRNRASDITVADYWGVHTRFPEYDDDLGVGLVIVNDDKGRAVWDRIAPDMDVLRSDLQHAAMYNHSYATPVPSHPRRDQFFVDLNRLPFHEVMQKYCGDPDLRPVPSGH